MELRFVISVVKVRLRSLSHSLVDRQLTLFTGEIGRYPIHFHLSRSVDGSIISRNSIRNSNQRCVVVHGTNKLLVQENVAYNTSGHCYILEDGGEIENRFVRNLGVRFHPKRCVMNSSFDVFLGAGSNESCGADCT